MFWKWVANNIINQETADLIVRSRIKWAEHGEKSSRYFCNLEKRSSEKKVKLFLDDLIHEDQNGFMKGRNIGCNISTIIDLIEYTDIKDIPYPRYNSLVRYWEGIW